MKLLNLEDKLSSSHEIVVELVPGQVRQDLGSDGEVKVKLERYQ